MYYGENSGFKKSKACSGIHALPVSTSSPLKINGLVIPFAGNHLPNLAQKSPSGFLDIINTLYVCKSLGFLMFPQTSIKRFDALTLNHYY
jgi:hypothetical protein